MGSIYLIGEAYVHGMMDGEVMKENPEVKKIMLYYVEIQVPVCLRSTINNITSPQDEISFKFVTHRKARRLQWRDRATRQMKHLQPGRIWIHQCDCHGEASNEPLRAALARLFQYSPGCSPAPHTSLSAIGCGRSITLPELTSVTLSAAAAPPLISTSIKLPLPDSHQ